MHKIQFFILFSIFLHILFFIALSSFTYRVKDNSKIEVFIVTEFSTPVRKNSNITKSLQKNRKIIIHKYNRNQTTQQMLKKLMQNLQNQ